MLFTDPTTGCFGCSFGRNICLISLESITMSRTSDCSATAFVSDASMDTDNRQVRHLRNPIPSEENNEFFRAVTGHTRHVAYSSLFNNPVTGRLKGQCPSETSSVVENHRVINNVTFILISEMHR